MTCAVYVRKADPDFVETFERVLNMKREQSQDVNAQVYGIINQVVESGDDALFALTEKFDGVTLTSQTVRFSKDEIDAA